MVYYVIREKLQFNGESDELACYNTDKGTIRIPYGKIDAELIGRIARWCNETGNHA